MIQRDGLGLYKLANHSPGAIKAFETAAQQAVKQHGYQRSSIQMSGDDADQLPEDSNNTFLPISAKVASQYKARFLHRLAAMASGAPGWAAPTIALMLEDNQQQSIRIWLAKPEAHQNSTDAASDVLTRIANILVQSRGRDNTPKKQVVWGDLWNLVTQCYHTRVQEYISETLPLFNENQALLEDLNERLMGVFADAPSDLDNDMGDKIVRLWGNICAFRTQELTEERCNDIIRVAFNLHQLPHVESRMRSILGGALASELHPKIRLLAQARRTFNTLVRAAQIFETSTTVVIRQGLPTGGDPKPSSMAPTTVSDRMVMPADSPSSKKISKRRQEFETSRKETDPTVRLFSRARPYLGPTEQHLNIRDLRPAARYNAFMLVAALLDGQNPDPAWEANHAFGYTACQTEHEVQTLGGLYAEILTKASDKPTTFNMLWRAAEKDALVQLFDEHGWDVFRLQIPGLESLLTTPPDKRESVFRLIQFIRTKDDTDPRPCLRRDYGFHRCKIREEVTALKHIYEDILKVLSPLRLHAACIRGELLEAAESAGVRVGLKNRRLLDNQYPVPGLGYDNIDPGTAFDKGLFERSVKR